jgi:hypothetical protein
MCIKRDASILFGILSGVRRLIIRPGAIGDFVVSLPALECLRSDYLEVWTAAPNVSLARFADRARAISSTGLDLVGVAEPPPALLDTLHGFDSIVSWYGTNRGEFRDAVAGLPFTFFTALPRDGSVHATNFYLEQVRSITNCASDGIPRIRCEVEREDFAVIRSRRPAARQRDALRRPLRACLLAGSGAPVCRERFRNHAPRGSGGDAGVGSIRSHGPRRLGSARSECSYRPLLTRLL